MQESGWRPWIPGSRDDARPGMTVGNIERFNTRDVVPAQAGTHTP